MIETEEYYGGTYPEGSDMPYIEENEEDYEEYLADYIYEIKALHGSK